MSPASASRRYGVGVASVAVAAAMASPLGRLIMPDPVEHLIDAVALQYAAVVLSAWLGGIGPGLLAAALAVLTLDFFITPPLYEMTPSVSYLPRLALFALSALLVASLGLRRRRIEAALQRSHDELEARVRERTADLMQQAALLDLTHDTVFARDSEDVITYWNRGAMELYGWKSDEAVGKVTHDLLKTVFPAPLKDIMAELTRAGRWEGELVHTRRNGTTVVVASRWSLQTDEQGRFTGILETNNDVTERKRAEESLRQTQGELAHVTRVTALGELAASIAHEINQPLAAIIADASACLHWLEGDRSGIPKVREALAAIVTDGERAAEVLTRIRALLSRSSVARQPCDVTGVIHDVLALAGPELRRHGMTLETSLAPGVPPVLADRIQLQQVLLNLLLDAAEASREVGPERRRLVVSTTLERRDDGAWVVVEVKDAGVGFQEPDVARVFEPFYTTKSDGLGMGLSISRSILEGHGGRLWATANPDHGATFSFALPVER